MESSRAEGGVPVQSRSATELFTRINKIIETIPDDFPQKDSIEYALRRRQESIRFTAPTAMSNRWGEVADILNDYLPDPKDSDWAGKIAQIFSANYE